MANEEHPTIRAAMDPMDDLVLAVRGDTNGQDPDYELPPSVSLDQASELLDLDPAEGLRRAEAGTYPVAVIAVGSRYRVGTARLVGAVGLDKVRQALRVEG
ncbi:hypothetical protein LKL35_26260 [Streptomyces sp. ET3-23]|uniref:hypothetical protein n=1 Tax=Streptomyces sp. ET3-23 TaxID=2885643 RepID=UPI001D10BE58|nr:hypothetical protein [Streptomyces sp. ET3-23]MCC2278904.1 hypothetical protein [Streptomyces sp. ET3-23]